MGVSRRMKRTKNEGKMAARTGIYQSDVNAMKQWRHASEAPYR